MATPKPQTWLEIAIRQAGLRKAIRGLTWANMWATTREDIGHDPSVEEVAAWWKASVRSTYREQAAFRDCYPTLDSPAPMFTDPELGARIRHAIETAEAATARSKAAASPDNAVMTIGLLTPPPGLLG